MSKLSPMQSIEATILLMAIKLSGCEETVLDELVHDIGERSLIARETCAGSDGAFDAQARICSNVNNEGIERQIEFLLENGATRTEIQRHIYQEEKIELLLLPGDRLDEKKIALDTIAILDSKEGINWEAVVAGRIQAMASMITVLKQDAAGNLGRFPEIADGRQDSTLSRIQAMTLAIQDQLGAVSGASIC